MAVVWIKRIIHSSPAMGIVTLHQNDPTWHPVIAGHQIQSDQPIEVHPGQTIDAEYFVIPWADAGRLRMTYLGKSIDYTVAGINASSGDYLRADDGATGSRIEVAAMGPKGPGPICSIDLHLLLHDGRAEFQYWTSSGTGQLDPAAVAATLAALAAAVAAFI